MVVNCIAYKNNKWGEVEMSSDFKIYPCCTIHAHHQLDKTFNDEYLNSLPKDWKDLTKNSLDEILKIYRNYIKPEKWLDIETTPGCCKRACLK